MSVSEYLSKRISWNPPLRLPRLPIPSIFSMKGSTRHTPRSPVVDDTSSDVTAISYPKSQERSRRARLRAYMRQISRSLIRSFKPQTKIAVPEPEAKLDGFDMPVMHSRFQLPPSPSFLASSPCTPTFPMLEFPEISQIQADRTIHAEQDAAYEKSQKLDQERFKKLLEKKIREEEILKKHAEQQEQERIRECEAEAHKQAQNDWRRWARRARIPAPEPGNSVQFAVRLPCGRRFAGTLPLDAPLEIIHILVETLLIPPSFSPEDDPEDPPEGYEHHWCFKIITTNPRFIIPNDPNSRIGGLEVIKKGVLLIVEEDNAIERNDPRELSRAV